MILPIPKESLHRHRKYEWFSYLLFGITVDFHGLQDKYSRQSQAVGVSSGRNGRPALRYGHGRISRICCSSALLNITYEYCPAFGAAPFSLSGRLQVQQWSCWRTGIVMDAPLKALIIQQPFLKLASLFFTTEQ